MSFLSRPPSWLCDCVASDKSVEIAGVSGAGAGAGAVRAVCALLVVPHELRVVGLQVLAGVAAGAVCLPFVFDPSCLPCGRGLPSRCRVCVCVCSFPLLVFRSFVPARNPEHILARGVFGWDSHPFTPLLGSCRESAVCVVSSWLLIIPREPSLVPVLLAVQSSSSVCGGWVGTTFPAPNYNNGVL